MQFCARQQLSSRRSSTAHCGDGGLHRHPQRRVRDRADLQRAADRPVDLTHAAKIRPPSARAQRDAVLQPALFELWKDNFRVYGARKLWKAAGRAEMDVGRDQVARLMRQMDIRGVNRSKKVRTTRAEQGATRHPDLVDRQFIAERPNGLWVTDLTYVPTWSGVAYVCFIIDAYSRMIVGWRCASNMRTQMVLDAIEMARWSRGTTLEGLVCHSDAGSQGGLNRRSQHHADEAIVDVGRGPRRVSSSRGSFAVGC
jgi:putative transposase